MDDAKINLMSQYAEINAAVLYRAMAKTAETEEVRKIFLDAAADEGRHAAILSEYTGKKIKPFGITAKIGGLTGKLIPAKILYAAIAKTEFSGGDSYRATARVDDKFKSMMEDEFRHGEIFTALAKKK